MVYVFLGIKESQRRVSATGSLNTGEDSPLWVQKYDTSVVTAMYVRSIFYFESLIVNISFATNNIDLFLPTISC